MLQNRNTSWKLKLYKIVFESDTQEGKIYDIIQIILIFLSSAIVMLSSIESINNILGDFFLEAEWFFVILFSIEYVIRIICTNHKLRYVTSFFGIIDLLTVIPAYVSLFVPGVQFLMVIRVFRLLRFFGIFKMVRYMEESRLLLKALLASRPKITVFLVAIFSVITMIGSIMYVVEGPENGFKSIPESIYWAIVTISTVGYGDISPQTPIGKFISSSLMIIGYGVLAVPTGIISFEMANASKQRTNKQCPSCYEKANPNDASYCKKCGHRLDP